MESTGSNWKPVFHVREGYVKVALANPHEVKARKGHKTDPQDSWWLAHLLRHGMGTASFIPPRRQRELRDLTRRRGKLIQNAAAEKNRVGQVLEDANVKLGNVLSDVLGVSGQGMLEALWKGKADAAGRAPFAPARAKKKIPAITAAREEHPMNEHHRRMIGFRWEPMRFWEDQLVEIDQLMGEKIQQAG